MGIKMFEKMYVVHIHNLKDKESNMLKYGLRNFTSIHFCDLSIELTS